MAVLDQAIEVGYEYLPQSPIPNTDARLQVPMVRRLGEVGRAHIHPAAVHDDELGVDTGMPRSRILEGAGVVVDFRKGIEWPDGAERSEANCLTSGCKSRRRRSPCGAVVISGSLRGDSWAGSPDVQAPGGQVGLEPPWSGQHRGQAIRRAVAKANGLNAEMGPRTKLIQAEYWRCQEFLPSTRWPVPMRKDGAVPVSDLPAEVEGGNPGEPSSKSSEGLESRQEDP